MHFYEINFLFISFYWFKFLKKHCYCFQSVYYVFIFDVFNLKTEHILYENVPGCVIVRCLSPKRNNMYYALGKKLCLSYFRSCCPGWFVYYVFIFDVFNLKTEHILYENVPGCVIVRC